MERRGEERKAEIVVSDTYVSNTTGAITLVAEKWTLRVGG